MLDAEEKTIDAIYKLGNKKKLEGMIKQAENSSGNKKEAEKLLKVIKDLENSTNIYERGAYKELKSEIKKLEKSLKGSETIQFKKIFLRPSQSREIILFPFLYWEYR